MILAWMSYAMMVGAFVALAGIAVESILHAGKRPVRFVWSGAIVLTIALALLAPFRRAVAGADISVSLNVAESTGSVAANPSLAATIATGIRAFMQLLATPIESVSSLVARTSASVDTVVVIAWILTACIALFMLATVYTRFAQRRSAWPSLHLFGERVRVAPNEGPAVMGIAPPEIVIPQWVLSRDTTEQQLVIAHEREHVRTRDPLLLLAGCIAVALMPWNAALWFMWSRLRLAIELDCDNRVLRSGARKPEYGQLLLELAEQRARLSPIMPAFAFGTSHLEQRLVAMTSRPLRHRMVRLVVSSSVIAVALAAACRSELPTAAQVENMDVAAVQAKFQPTAASAYTIDGKTASESDAAALAPTRIASIAVVRSDKGKRVAQINIRTRNDSSVALLSDTLVLRSGNRTLSVLGDTGKVRVSAVGKSMHIFSDAPANDSEGASTSTGAQPNDTTIRIRKSSLYIPSQNKPLVMIDGVEFKGSFDSLNPDSISSIEIIKGPKAVQLYGDRATYGAILITLKH